MNAKFKTANLSGFDKNGLEYKTLRELRDGVKHLKEISFGGREFIALVTFTQSTFAEEYTPEQRTYVLESGSPYFGGRQIFDGEPLLVGDALTDDDPGVFIMENIEGKFGAPWQVEKCMIPSVKGFLVPRAMILPSARTAFATIMARETLRTWKADRSCKPEDAEAKAEAMAKSVLDGTFHFWHADSMKIEGTAWPEDADFFKRNPSLKNAPAKRAAFIEEHKEVLAAIAPPPPAPAKKPAPAKQSEPAKGKGKRATASETPDKLPPVKAITVAESKNGKGKAMTKPEAAAAIAKTSAPAAKPATAKPKADPKHEKRLPPKPAPAPAKAPGKAKPSAKPTAKTSGKAKKPAKK